MLKTKFEEYVTIEQIKSLCRSYGVDECNFVEFMEKLIPLLEKLK